MHYDYDLGYTCLLLLGPLMEMGRVNISVDLVGSDRQNVAHEPSLLRLFCYHEDARPITSRNVINIFSRMTVTVIVTGSDGWADG